jgi:hypothetical protein
VSLCSIEIWRLQGRSGETKNTVISKGSEMLDVETLDGPWPF